MSKSVNIDQAWTVPRLNNPPRELVNEKNKQKVTHLHDLDIPVVLEESFGTKYDQPVSDPELRSQEDEKALQQLQVNTTFREDLGHYETGLLWKSEPILPNNLELAKTRLAQLDRILGIDLEKAQFYNKTMNGYIEKGYARKVTGEEANIQQKNTWHLSHHAVTNINKPGKVREVFNAAAEYKGICIHH
jgi:hypothetical protein